MVGHASNIPQWASKSPRRTPNLKVSPMPYNDRCVDMSTTFPDRCRGGISFDINSEWFPIVHDAMAHMISIDRGIQFTQVKNKFGGLRIYYAPSLDCSQENQIKLEAVVSRAEEEIWKLPKKE